MDVECFFVPKHNFVFCSWNQSTKGEKGEKGERGLTTTLDGNAFPTGFIEGPAGKFQIT